MSDKPATPDQSASIGVGDLVMVVRGHSCVLERLGGMPYRVTAIRPQIDGGWTCNACWTRDIAPEQMYGATLSIHTDQRSAIPLGWLKRIPPLSELEGENTKEKIHEPA